MRRALTKLVPPTAEAADLVRKTALYFRTHAHRMQYPAFRARHFPIGSGAIESCAKNLIQTRQVQAGMRWTTAGAQCLASLRALQRSGRWAAFRHSQPQRRLRLRQPRQPRTGASTDQPLLPPLGVDQAACLPAPAPPTLDPGAPARRRPDPTLPPATPEPAPRSRKPWEKGTDYWRRQSLLHRRSA